MRKIFPALIGFAWTFGIALSAPSSAQQSIRIGVSLSITGKQYSVQGGYGREGYLLCQKDVNAHGGVLRRPIEFLIYDDGSDENTAARNYEKLITEDKVDAVLGPYGSAITEAVADVTEKHRKLMIAPMAATTSIWEKGRRFSRPGLSGSLAPGLTLPLGSPAAGPVPGSVPNPAPPFRWRDRSCRLTDRARETGYSV